MAACATFAEKARPMPVIRPVVDAISGFIAVIPAEPVDALQQLAADCVRDFDSFRAPLTADDRARRKPEKLSERQREYLDRWGYPYVMEEFRFHMTLTGRLDAERRGPILEMLRARFATLKLETLAIDRITLFKQDDAKARFRIIGEWTLARPPPQTQVVAAKAEAPVPIALRDVTGGGHCFVVMGPPYATTEWLRLTSPTATPARRAPWPAPAIPPASPDAAAAADGARRPT